MAVSRFERCEARIDADVGRRLVDAKTETGDLDSGIVERKEVCKGEFGGRHGRLGVGIVECFSFCSAFVRGLILSGQRAVVRMDMSRMLSQ